MQPTRYRNPRGIATPFAFESEAADAADTPDLFPDVEDDDGGTGGTEDLAKGVGDHARSAAEPGEPTMGEDGAAPEPPLWQTPDGDVLHLPPYILDRLILRGGGGRRRRQRPQAPMRRPPRPARRALLRRIGQLTRGARRVGALRHHTTNQRYPVFRARSPGRSYRIVARPRNGLRHEIVLVSPLSLDIAKQREAGRAGNLDRRLAYAVERNREWAHRLGWDGSRSRIAQLVGFTHMTPTDTTLAEGVMLWQRRHGLTEDGIVGPATWKRMQRAIGASTAPKTESPTSFRPVPLSRLGGGRVPLNERRDPAPEDIVHVPHANGKDRVPLHREVARALLALQKVAEADGIRPPLLRPTSGYRSSARQRQLWDAAVERYGSPQEARKWVAPPGSSAHQSGRAADFYLGGKNSSGNVARLRTLPAYRWLVRNAVRFGFYPYDAEPWHWEYNPPAFGANELEVLLGGDVEEEVGC